MAVGDGVGVGVGVGFGFGFDVGEGGADEGEAVPGWVLVPPGPGVVADGWAAGLEAPGLADALAEPDAEWEELGRVLPARGAPAVGCPTTCTEVALALAPSVGPGSPASGAEAGTVAPSEWPEDIATVPRPPPATRPTTDSTSALRRRPELRRLPRRRSTARPGNTGAIASGCSTCQGSSSGGSSSGRTGNWP
ncbi:MULTISPECIES: hypothetical protein [unclassified Kitasatospora]|uniref:hypothetical protein n=1 Tax=unclassified Kitasatospora TaxID=2633591 RepID=UPI002473763C|nr:hypothetical protein [Kitasatospora sp. MAP12-44]